MVDALPWGGSEATHAGSNPVLGTKIISVISNKYSERLYVFKSLFNISYYDFYVIISIHHNYMKENNFVLQALSLDDDFHLEQYFSNIPWTQDKKYLQWHHSVDRAVFRFLILYNNYPICYLQMIRLDIFKNKIFGEKNILYSPFGPIINAQFLKEDKDIIDNFFIFLKQEIKKIAEENNTFFVRFDFPKNIDIDMLRKHFKVADKKTYKSPFFQPRNEWYIDLRFSKVELFKNMSESNRRYIRKAEKADLKVEIITKDFEKYFEDFYNLLNITAKRNNFSLHQKKYYKYIFDNFHKWEKSYLCISRFETKILTMDLILVNDNVAHYIYGGSLDEYREKYPALLAKWKAIEYAKDLDLKYFNLGAVSDESDDSSWDNLSIFKKKFGGYKVAHNIFFDIVVGKLWYSIYILKKIILKK